MAGKRELGLRLPSTTRGTSLRGQLAIKTLRNVKLQGHTYVELREDEKRMIFFCTLCLSPCYSDSVLYDHLKGKIHTERLVAAKKTLIKPNPWPFNDGVYFFHESGEEVKELPASNADKLRFLEKSLEIDDDNSLAIVAHGGSTQPGGDERDFSGGLGSGLFDSNGDRSGHDQDLDGISNAYDLIIPGVLHKEEIRELYVRFIGVGQIAARVFEKDGSLCRMWCEWLGKKVSGNEDQQHDFSIVTFPYNYDLGRKGLLNDVRYLLLSSSQQLTEGVNKKRKKSFSDPEDISESLSNQYDSSGDETMSSNSSSSKLLLGGCDDQILQSGLASSRTLRKQLRKQQHVAAEKTCDICQHKLLPGKDVGTLLNLRTGRIACSSRNVNGAFHVYHVSCLVHWVLLCESQIHNKPMVLPEVKHTSKSKNGGWKRELEQHGGTQSSRKQIYSVFCPECQGTGMNIHGGELEKPTISINEMFRYKMKICDGRRAWMKSPEALQNCSTGFHFPSESQEAIQEMILSSLKMLHFYRADEETWACSF